MSPDAACTGRHTVRVPEELEAALQAAIAAGTFENESVALREGLRAVLDQEGDTDE